MTAHIAKPTQNPHTYRKIENPGKSWDPEVPGSFWRFRTRILTKNATCSAKNMVLDYFYNVFGTQDP